jgi:tellurite resistance protein
MAENPPEGLLVQGLEAVAEDALFAVAAAGEDDENVFLGLGKRRADLYERVVRGQSRILTTSYRDWTTSLAAAIAPVRPPLWMPMAELVRQGVTVEGGARGMRAFFTSKPSEKQIEHVRRVGSLAVRALVAVLAADGDLDTDEQDSRVALVASFGLSAEDEQRLSIESPVSVDELEIYGDLDPKLAKEVIRGAWLGATGDGIDPREERVIATLATKLNVRPEDVEAARNEARKATDDQRDIGAAAVDAIRYVLIDDPDRAVLLGKAAARLFLPRRHRLEPLSALHQRSTITLANRFHLDKTGQSVVLAASWLAALHSNPTSTRRIPLLLRHEDVAKDLRADTTGASVREKIDRVVESQLQVAALAARS